MAGLGLVINFFFFDVVTKREAQQPHRIYLKYFTYLSSSIRHGGRTLRTFLKNELSDFTGIG